MKFQPNKNYTTIALYCIAVLAAVIILYAFVNNIASVWSGLTAILGYLRPVTYGILLALILNPILRFYESKVLSRLRRKRAHTTRATHPARRRAVAILLTLLTVVLTIVIIFGLFIPQMIGSFGGLIKRMPEYAEQINAFIRSVTDSLEAFRVLEPNSEVAKLITGLTSQLTSSLSNIGGNVDAWLSAAASQILSLGAQMASGFVNWVLGFLISIYILFDREKLFAQARKISVALLPERIVQWIDEISVEAAQIFKGFLVGKVIGSLFVGILCSLGMVILRIPYPIPIGVLIGLTNIFPYFGPFVGAILGTLLILLINPFKALLFLVFVIALQQFDNNVLEPKILGGRTGLSALWVVVSVLLFGGLFGMMGMFLGVPVFAIIYAVLKKVVAHSLIQKGKSADTRDYASENNPLIR